MPVLHYHSMSNLAWWLVYACLCSTVHHCKLSTLIIKSLSMFLISYLDCRCNDWSYHIHSHKYCHIYDALAIRLIPCIANPCIWFMLQHFSTTYFLKFICIISFFPCYIQKWQLKLTPYLLLMQHHFLQNLSIPKFRSVSLIKKSRILYLHVSWII